MPQGHYENFPVASVLCPPRIRPAVVAIYHFARTADDLADEGDASPEDRLALLAEYRGDLIAALANRNASQRWPQVFAGLQRQADAHALPGQPLHALLDAFEQDVHNPPYPDRASLLHYCERSANPVGRLLLHLYGVHDPLALRRSDDICTALQLINFWQDLSRDGPRGRCYVPECDRLSHGVDAQDLATATDSPAARRLVQTLTTWAVATMNQGAPLATNLPGRIGWELRLVVQGGLTIASKLRQRGFDSLVHRPKLTVWDTPGLLWRAATMRHSPHAATALDTPTR
ncbi:MAG: squalene synthase HpnC [Rubrivivax sp.]